MNRVLSLVVDWRKVFFFFSSRRRHTRYWRDWSSDVCSSDLSGKLNKGSDSGLSQGHTAPAALGSSVTVWGPPSTALVTCKQLLVIEFTMLISKIGRASCRERV